MQTIWQTARGIRASYGIVGFLPDIFLADDPRPGSEQVNDRYAHGGGWRPFGGFEALPENKIQYPGDPPYLPRAWTTLLSGEIVTIYDHAWVKITKPDQSWEISRMD